MARPALLLRICLGGRLPLRLRGALLRRRVRGRLRAGCLPRACLALLGSALPCLGRTVHFGLGPVLRLLRLRGLLGLRLAGDAWYHGVLHKKDYIGDAKREIELEDIPRAGRLMYLTAVLALVVFGAGKALLIVL